LINRSHSLLYVPQRVIVTQDYNDWTQHK